MNFDHFMALPDGEVARLVRQAGPQVCVFPINGTRRWFALEHPDASAEEYVRIAALEYIRLFRLLFEHGIDTILSPLFGSELLNRGERYVAKALGGAVILESPEFLAFYDGMQVRVRFYGEYRRALAGTPHAGALDLVERVAGRTETHAGRRLFFGLFANDATETVARLAVEIHERTGQVPDRRALVAAYYGEYVEPATLFVGFEKPAAFDYPLLALGEEDLYFTAAPSPYLTPGALRSILYDHLYTRRAPEPEWFGLPPQEQQRLRDCYRAVREDVLGVGDLADGVWRFR